MGENIGEKRLELNYGRGRIGGVGFGVGSESGHGGKWSGSRLKVQFSRRYILSWFGLNFIDHGAWL